eukprot:SAG31_NODE_750_length_12362_cov_6.912827_3_plen_68_part_00
MWAAKAGAEVERGQAPPLSSVQGQYSQSMDAGCRLSEGNRHGPALAAAAAAADGAAGGADGRVGGDD